MPSYTAEYQLSNNDYNVKQLRKRYDISTNKAPKLILTGVGEFKGSSVGYKNLKMEFEQNEEKSTNFSDTVSYKPSRIERITSKQEYKITAKKKIDIILKKRVRSH